eukprot:11021926-Heterocapsa_arctica.AAC.1
MHDWLCHQELQQLLQRAWCIPHGPLLVDDDRVEPGSGSGEPQLARTEACLMHSVRLEAWTRSCSE